MRTCLRSLLMICAFLSFQQKGMAKSDLLIPSPPHIHAKSYLLIDAYSGQILAEKNKDLKLAPASLTKLMSLYVIGNALDHQQIHLTDQVTISKKAWKMTGSRMFIRERSRVSVEDLIKGMIVASGNDATIAMAEYVGGSESSFVDLMNQTAVALQMDHSHFQNATGLPHKDHYTTAGDLAHLAKAYIHDFPDHYHWYKQKWIKYNNIRQPNRNRLLWRDPRVDGLKTGHTDSAGYCLIASGIDHDTRLIAVVMGASSDENRASQTENLLNYGFRYFESSKIKEKNQPIASMRIWQGDQKEIQVGLAHDTYITVARGDRHPPLMQPKFNPHLLAPIHKGQIVGTLNIIMGHDKTQSYPLIALEDVKEGSLLQKWRDIVIAWSTHHD